MSETLTASFCERCGTRQEFSAPTTVGPLRRTRGFIGGLKNYLVTDDGLSDAMRDAMQLQESAVSAAQLEAFHAAIHLCLDCRQYTCNDCWNTDAGRCLTCAPRASTHADAEGFPSLSTLPDDVGGMADGVVPVFERVTVEPLPAEAWPTADHEVYPALSAHELMVVAENDDAAFQSTEPLPTKAPLFDSEADAADAIAAELARADATRVEEEAARAAAEQTRVEEEEAARAEAERARLEQEDEERAAAAAAEQARLQEEAEQAAAAERARLDELEAVQRAEAETARQREEEAAREAHRIAVAAELDAELAAAYTGAMAQLRVVQPNEAPVVSREHDEPTVETSQTDALAVDTPGVDDLTDDRPILRVMGWDEDDADAHVGQSEPAQDAFAAESANAEEEEALPAAAAERWEEPYEAPAVAEALDEHLEYDDATANEAVEPAIPAWEPADEPEAAALREADPEPTDGGFAPQAPIGPAGAGRSIPMRDRVIRLPDRTDGTPRERVAASADTPEVLARRAQLEQLGLDAAPSDDARDPRVLPFSPATRRADGGSLWEASAREIGGAGVAVQNCGGCGLALSASAQFCRRCGTRQAQSA